MNTLAQRIKDAAKETGSVVCVGLDPVVEKLPKTAPTIVKFNAAIIEATTDVVAAYKLNMAFYLAEGIPGLKAMEETIACVRRNAPHALLIADAKLGDVEHAADAYATAYFETWDFDVVTLSPYIGSDAIKPFLKYLHKGVFVCVRTSNPHAYQIQEALLLTDDLSVGEVFRLAASQVYKLHSRGKQNIGMMIGTNYIYELRELNKCFVGVPFLIDELRVPLKSIVNISRICLNAVGDVTGLLCAPFETIYASSGAEFGYAARKACIDLNTILKPEGVSNG